jgi:hypothetical protein
MENYKNFNKQQKKEFWSEHFRLWEQSDLSQKKYCDTNKISYWSFKTWYAGLKPYSKPEKKFIKIPANSLNHVSANQIEIFLSSNLKIIVSENISEENLRKIFSSAGTL